MTTAATWNSKSNAGPRGSTVLAFPPCEPDALGSPRPGEVEKSLRLTLFGSVGLHAGKREILVKQRKAKALLAYLALAPGMTESRDRLVGLLWSDSGEPQARASLRQLLHALNDIFHREGFQGFWAGKTQVSLNPALFTSELDGILASIDAGHPIDCLVNEMRITEKFLCGYDELDPCFGDWLRVQRESVRQRLIRALEAQLAGRPRPMTLVKRIACALLHVDPTHELACQHLMRAHLETGNAAGALLAYKCLWEHLEQDYDIEPSIATQELAVAIKRGTCAQPVVGWVWRKPVACETGRDAPDLGIILAK